MVKLKWLEVNKFRSVKPGTRLTFNDGHNVLLGQNGTGKTTLLNLIAAAIKSDFTDFRSEEFDVSYELASVNASASITARNAPRAMSIPLWLDGVAVKHSAILASAGGVNPFASSFVAMVCDERENVRLKIDNSERGSSFQRVDSFRGVNKDGPVVVDAQQRFEPLVVVLASLFKARHSDNPVLPEESFSEESFDEFISLFSGFRLSRFDESLEYFDRMGRYECWVTQDSEGNVGFSGSFDAEGIVDTSMLSDLVKQRWGEDRYILGANEVPFLEDAIQLLDFEAAELVLELRDSSVSELEKVMHLGGMRFYFRRPGGSKISDKMLSYGQKRMLAFMYYVAEVNSVIIADELVNGLHHQWIHACFEQIGERQSFLTSQNPLLLDYLRFESPEDVRSTFVLCSRDKASEQMAWENMSQEAAEDFFDSYNVGFQQVGELLQSKGLW